VSKITLDKIKSFFFKNTSARQTVAKNAFWLTTSNVFGRIIKAALIIYAARVLGASGYGIFSYAVSLAAFFSIFSDIGISGIVTREAAKEKGVLEKYFSAGLTIKLFLTSASAVLVIFVAPLFTNIKEAVALLPLTAILIAADGLRDFCFSITRAWEKMELEGTINIATNIAITVIGLLVLIVHPTPKALLLGYTLGSAIGLVSSVWILRKTIAGFRPSFDFGFIKTLFKDAWPFALMGLLGTIMVNTDALAIGYFRGAFDLGLYSAAQRPVLLLYLLPAVLSTSLFPGFARLAKDNNRFRNVFETSMSLAFLASLPIFAGGLILAKGIILLLYGAEYAGAAATFAVLLLTVVLVFPQTLITNAIFAYNRQKSFALIVALGAIGNLVLDIIFIPRFGIIGSATGTLITQAVITAMMWRAMKKINDFHVWPRLKKIALATFVMSAVAIFLTFSGVNVLANIILCAAVYAIVLIKLRESLIQVVAPKKFNA